MKPLHQQEPVREICTEALLQLGKTCSSLKFAVMVSDDGFEVASAGTHAQQGGRLASMTSSMQALGDAVAAVELHEERPVLARMVAGQQTRLGIEGGGRFLRRSDCGLDGLCVGASR